MKKRITAILLAMLIVLATPAALAGSIVILANPDLNLDDPEDMPYSAPFSFKKYTATKAIAQSDGTITVRLVNTSLSISRTASITVRVYYRNSANTYWIAGNSTTVTINGTSSTYSVNLSLPAGRVFYIRLSKTDYTDYYASGSITVTA